MASLKGAMRTISKKYDKRAICSINYLFDIINIALNEKISTYMIVFAYENNLYTIGYTTNNNIIFGLSLSDGSTKEFEKIDDLRNQLNFNHDVTVLREYQSIASNDIVELTIQDNYALKSYFIDSLDERFNYNMSNELINEYNNLLINANKENFKTNLFLVGGVIFIILIIIIVCLFG